MNGNVKIADARGERGSVIDNLVDEIVHHDAFAARREPVGHIMHLALRARGRFRGELTGCRDDSRNAGHCRLHKNTRAPSPAQLGAVRQQYDVGTKEPRVKCSGVEWLVDEFGHISRPCGQTTPRTCHLRFFQAYSVIRLDNKLRTTGLQAILGERVDETSQPIIALVAARPTEIDERKRAFLLPSLRRWREAVRDRQHCDIDRA